MSFLTLGQSPVPSLNAIEYFSVSANGVKQGPYTIKSGNMIIVTGIYNDGIPTIINSLLQ